MTASVCTTDGRLAEAPLTIFALAHAEVYAVYLHGWLLTVARTYGNLSKD